MSHKGGTGKCILCEKNSKNKNICCACYRDLRRIKIKQDLVTYKGGKCEVCGYNKCMRALTFHHINPNEKDFNISNKYSASLNSLKKEADKCQLLCHNCHNEVHEKQDMERKKDYQKKYEYFQKYIKIQPLTNKKCKHCFNNFMPDKSSRVYCSVKCCNEANPSKMPPKEELQALIWQKPTTHIAKQFGVSDKAVEKWCKKYEINKPPRGYWTKRSKL